MEESEILKITVKNAIEHGGRANSGAVFSKVAGSDKSILKDLKSAKALIEKVVSEVNSKTPEDVANMAEDLGIELNEKPKEQKLELKALPNVDRQVILRLPPEPSGYMHLGHAFSFMINYLYKEKYNGKLWLRFEDTNPKLLDRVKEFVKAFEDGIAWLGIKWDEEKFISSDIETMYSYAEKLIKESKAYMCLCSAEEIKDKRLSGEECVHRQNAQVENLKLWNSAKNGEIGEGGAVLRLKLDMKNKNSSLRDPNIFRIIKSEKSRYSLWPLYHFANVIEDQMCGVTHILRSNEFNTDEQEKIRTALGLRNPTVLQYGRYNLKGTTLSKRLIRQFIKDGLLEDWNDIRCPTVSAIRRRGIQPEAIRDFVITVGYSGSQHEYSWDLLFTLNRRIIDEKAKRFFFVSRPAKLYVSNGGKRDAKLQFHPLKNSGFRLIKTNGNFLIDEKDFSDLKVGDKVRLKDLYTIQINELKDGIANAEMISESMLGGEKIVQWVTDENLKTEVSIVGQMLNEDGTFNKDSLKVVNGLAERAVGLLNEGDIIQFERFGFCRLDNKEKNSFIYISR